MIGVLQGPWFVGAALVLLLVVVRRGARPRGEEVWLVAAIVACAAAARLLFGVWGPLHVNGQGPLWIRGALDAEALQFYGPGYFELFGWMTRLGGAPDRAIFTANALLSALSPALLYATARLVGVERGGACAAAVVLAADAVTVRTAASEWYASSFIALVLGVQAALALGVQADLRGDRPSAWLARGGAGLLAAAAARIHPMAYVPLALCPLVVLGAAWPEAWRGRLVGTALAAAVIGAVVLVSSGSTIVTVLHASTMAGQAFVGLDGREIQLLLALLVALLVLRRWIRPPWLPLLGLGSLTLMLATQGSFQQHPLWKLDYQRVFLPGVLLGAAAALPRRMQGLGWALASAAAVMLVLLVGARPYLGVATTEQLEYRFLQEVLRAAPPDCTLAAVSRVGKRVWEIPSYLVPTSGAPAGAQRTVQGPSDLDGVGAGDCLLYVRSALCSSSEARALCESVEREVRLEAVAKRVFPAAPSYVDLPYDRSEVEVAVFRVTGGATRSRQAMVRDGAAITPAFAQALYERLTPLREADGCRLSRFDTQRFRITVELETRSGAQHAFELSAGAEGAAGRRVGAWALAVPAELEHDCGATLAAIEAVLAETEQGAHREEGPRPTV